MAYRSYAANPSGGLNNTLVPNYTYRVAASYVTGTHTFKTGWNDTFGYLNAQNYAYQPISYTFLNGTPTAVTQYAAPFNAISNENHDFGTFAQDTVRLSRATVTGAIRYDWFKTSFPAQTVGAGSPLVGLANRNISFPEQDNLNWKDITYRTGFVYDVRGNGKSAVKVAANKYLLGQTLNGFGTSPNPVNARRRTRSVPGPTTTTISSSTATWRTRARRARRQQEASTRAAPSTTAHLDRPSRLPRSIPIC